MFISSIKSSNNPIVNNVKFRSLMIGLFFFNCSDWIERLCISWLILQSTESILATTISFAIGQIIQTFFSPFTAAAADKFGRNKIIIIVGILRFIILSIFAILVIQNKNFLLIAYCASAMTGINRSFIVPALQGSVINSVKENQKILAMLIYSLIMRATGVIGSLIGGIFSILVGIEEAIILSGALGLIGSFSILLKANNLIEIKNQENYLSSIKKGLSLVFGNFYSRNLLIFAGIVEIFGFSFFSLLSSISKYILKSEIGTLSILQTTMSIGSFLGIILLFKWKDINKAHILASIITVSFGVSIILIPFFPNLVFVIILLLVIGASSASFDAIQWIFLQKNIPNELRSTAVSAWFITIGFGWLGHIMLGYFSDNYGLEITILLTGIILLISGLIFFVLVRLIGKE